jgi:hypothetical protein
MRRRFGGSVKPRARDILAKHRVVNAAARRPFWFTQEFQTPKRIREFSCTQDREQETRNTWLWEPPGTAITAIPKGVL